MYTMIKYSIRSTGLFAVLLLTACSAKDQVPGFEGFRKPAHFPEPVYDMQSNPVTEAGFVLGRSLFYDGRLSRDGSISCGSCHIQYSAFSHHGHDVSHGIDDKLGTRNAPALQNLAWYSSYFWDGGVHNLDLVPVAPIENPVEMDETTANVVEKLRNDPDYRRMCRKAFGDEELSGHRMLMALAQFMSMMISSGSQYDRYIGGDASAFTAGEKEGLDLFRLKCASCHAEPLFTDNSFRNNGLPGSNDPGRYAITGKPQDMGRFKVPSLRNLKYSAPYMHNGSIGTLEEVLLHYRDGVQPTVATDPQLQNGISMSSDEMGKIILFLNTLSDPGFLKNEQLSEQ